MNYRNRKRWRKVGLYLLFFIALFGISATGIVTYFCRKNRLIAKETREELEEYKRLLYVAAEDMYAGEVITQDKVVRMPRYSDEAEDIYMSDSDFDKVLAVDVVAGSCLTKSMLIEQKGSQREVFISKVDISEYLEEGNRVDVRISYGNAEDYVVLAGKTLVHCDEKKGIVLRMSEEEILILSSALFDCDIYMDTELYLVKYPEFQRMEESEVTYIPNKEVLTLLGREEGYDEKRIRMEERLIEK